VYEEYSNMRMQIRFIAGLATSLCFAAPDASAERAMSPLSGLVSSKSDSLCFGRTYSDAHLARHPGQLTQAVMLSFRQDAIRIMLRQKQSRQPMYVVSSCEWSERAGVDTEGKRMIAAFRGSAGFDCIVMVTRMSAEEGGYVLIDPALDAKSLVLHIDSPVNAKRGLDKDGSLSDLKLGNEDREFKLMRTKPAECKPMEDTLEGP
jgi:hypothetical protein